MSNASNKICLAVMRGTTMRLPIQIAWQGDGEADGVTHWMYFPSPPNTRTED